jgi:hypothetical protein
MRSHHNLFGLHGLYIAWALIAEVFSLLGRVFQFRFPDLQTSRLYSSLDAEFVVFGDMLRSTTRRGRAPANNSDVLAMFRLVYSGEGATEPLVDDSSWVNVLWSQEYSAAWLTWEPTAGLEAATVLQTHQRTEVAASFRQKLAKPGPLEPNQMARLSQKVEGDGLLP